MASKSKVELKLGRQLMGDGLRSIIRAMEQRGNSLEDITPAIAQLLVSAVEDVFESEGFGSWPDLAPATIRARRGTNAKILQDTGNLAGSIQPRSGSRVAEAFTRVPYAKFHVSDAPRNVIPKRDFLAIKFKDVTSQAAQILLREVLK